MNTETITENQSPKNLMSWKEVLQSERQSAYFQNILKVIEEERRKGQIIYPRNSDMFSAFSLTPFEAVRVVIIGQDPYHGPNQAHGLSFSVRPGIKPPPSLVNIFKELVNDVGIAFPTHGYLEKWARQGVLLLNAVLSVRAGQPQSHASLGWQQFTDRVIKELNDKKENLVFLLWGSHAQKKGENIDRNRHLVLCAPHPSPFSANRGFFGCRHFSQTNQFLKSKGLATIDWSL